MAGGATFGPTGGVAPRLREPYGGPQTVPGGGAGTPQPSTTPGRANPLAWTPWAPTPIPTNYYDPVRDVEQAAGKRGAADRLDEIGRNRGYAESDFTQGQEKIGRERTRQNQDYQNALATLAESFKRLGGRQEERANAAGVFGGGALLQAAAKRTANEAIRRKPLDLSHERNEEGDNLALGALTQAHRRTLEGLGSQQSITEREDAQSGIDANFLKGGEAAGRGYEPPVKPSNEYMTKARHVVSAATGPQGRDFAPQPYHTISHGNEWWDVTPQGQVIKKRGK